MHWPFCKSKCPYCDFNSHVREGIDHSAWLEAFKRELDYYADYLQDKLVHSIFFGGGTPSTAEPRVIAGVIDHISANFSLENNAEITMEANPTSVEAENFRAIASAGVNRVSLGIQSLDDNNLRFLGRNHSAQEAMKAIELARDSFPRSSFDLIYALPEQSLDDWENELSRALDFGMTHLSLYQLTIEKGTKFFSLYRDKAFALPDEELAADMYELTETRLLKNGLHAYEVSNYAVPGQESRHNLQYWHMGDYLGIGAGAHSRITKNERLALQNISSPEEYLVRVNNTGCGLQSQEALDERTSETERIMMGLRLREWIPTSKIFSQDRLDELVSAGLLELEANKIRASEQGRLLLNSVLAHLMG